MFVQCLLSILEQAGTRHVSWTGRQRVWFELTLNVFAVQRQALLRWVLSGITVEAATRGFRFNVVVVMYYCTRMC